LTPIQDRVQNLNITNTLSTPKRLQFNLPSLDNISSNLLHSNSESRKSLAVAPTSTMEDIEFHSALISSNDFGLPKFDDTSIDKMQLDTPSFLQPISTSQTTDLDTARAATLPCQHETEPSDSELSDAITVSELDSLEEFEQEDNDETEEEDSEVEEEDLEVEEEDSEVEEEDSQIGSHMDVDDANKSHTVEQDDVRDNDKEHQDLPAVTDKDESGVGVDIESDIESENYLQHELITTVPNEKDDDIHTTDEKGSSTESTLPAILEEGAVKQPLYIDITSSSDAINAQKDSISTLEDFVKTFAEDPELIAKVVATAVNDNLLDPDEIPAHGGEQETDNGVAHTPEDNVPSTPVSEEEIPLNTMNEEQSACEEFEKRL